MANFIISLTHQCPQDLTPHAGKLLAALLSGLHDRNITVKKTYASAIGHLVKVSFVPCLVAGGGVTQYVMHSLLNPSESEEKIAQQNHVALFELNTKSFNATCNVFSAGCQRQQC